MKRLLVLLCCALSIVRAQEALTLKEIAADKTIWPVEVMVVVDHKLPMIMNGKVVKTLKFGPGTMYKVKSIGPEGVTVFALGGPKTFSAEETDVIARAGQNRVRQEALAATPTVPPADSVPPSPDAVPVPTTTLPAPAAGTLAAKLQGQLVRLNGGRMEPFDAALLGEKKFIAVYFSAAWCGPCRRFTPRLVDWYERHRGNLDQFEIIFVSSDRDEKSMAGYMIEDRMPWPAVSFAKARSNPLSKYGGRGIPCLVILNEHGQILSHSYDGSNYLGPDRPLQELDRLLKGK